MHCIVEPEDEDLENSSSRSFGATKKETKTETETRKEAEKASVVNAGPKVVSAKKEGTASLSPSSSPLQPKSGLVIPPTAHESMTDMRVRSDIRQPLSTPTPSVIRQIEDDGIAASLDAVTRVATDGLVMESESKELETAPSDGPALIPMPMPTGGPAGGLPLLRKRGGEGERALPRSQNCGSESPPLTTAIGSLPSGSLSRGPLSRSPSSLSRISVSISRQLSSVSSVSGEDMLSNARRVSKLVGDTAVSGAVTIQRNTSKFIQRPKDSGRNGEDPILSPELDPT